VMRVIGAMGGEQDIDVEQDHLRRSSG
jgi:hypothetical protein